jgi:hypothetical protein
MTNTPIRRHFDEATETCYFSIVDVIGVLSESVNPRDYLFRMKVSVKSDDGLELSTTETEIFRWEKICNRLSKCGRIAANYSIHSLKWTPAGLLYSLCRDQKTSRSEQDCLY